jgi:DNA polymerase-3 subunit alpha
VKSPTIVHLDADAFFASAEQAADPRLRGKPVAVGGEKRGIIASASYEARQAGVYTPMPTALARRLCPKLIVLPGDFERYEQFSNWMFGYCYDFTPDVEQTSIDEGYFDLSANRQSPVEIALAIRRAIGQKLKITVSEGIATNKLVSAVASKLTKPAAFNQVPPGQEEAFLRPLPNKWLPGVGPKTSARLNAAGLVRIGHIAGMPVEGLELLLGRQAAGLRQFARGIDPRPLIPAREPQKTFGQQETFAADLTDEEYAEATLRRMADQLFARVREEHRSIRTLTVKVRYNDMAEDQVSESLHEPTDLETDVYGHLRRLLRQAWKRRVSLRLVSLKLSNLYDGWSELPLGIEGQRRDARARLTVVIDELRQARGPAVLLRGHDFRLRRPPLSNVEMREASAGPRPHLSPAPVPSRVNLCVRPPAVQHYVPLRTHSHYSFLDSTLSPTALVGLAREHGLSAMALTDAGNLHGAPEFALAAQQAGVKPIFGVELRVGRQPLLLYVESARGYHHLNQLLSSKAEEERSEDGKETDSVAASQRAPISLAFLQRRAERLAGLIAVSNASELAGLFPGRFYRMVTTRTASIASAAELEPAAACPAIHYATPAGRRQYDVVQSIRTLTLLGQAHPEKRLGGRFHFRAPAEMAAACAGHPEWLERTLEIAERCRFEFPFGPPQFPDFQPPDGSTPRAFLRRLVLDGLRRRYRERARLFARQVKEELSIIAAVGYEAYFLIVWDLLQECRAQGIEWITRGSAADSLVCYCLGISGVCPIRFDLYFKRFLNPERMALNKLPDIDIDFPHDRKDDVVELFFARYGCRQCAVVGGFSTYQARGAVADVAKVLGVSEYQIRRFTEHFPGSGADGLTERLHENIECRDLPLAEEPYRTAVEMAGALDAVPRYPKMHPCGIILSRQPMFELTPTFIANKGLATAHYDMDAVEAMGLIKIDVLAQGGLAVMRDAKVAIARRGQSVDLEALEPWDDPEVWNMIARGGARAVHHIESPAMTNLCQMANVREIDGLIAIVSVIRPGAANESKKLKFTRRYQGMEPPEYPHPSLEPCLRSTFGLVVYEEHILQIAEAFAGLSPGRADVLRRALVKQKSDKIAEIGREFIASARARGHPDAKIAEVWELVAGFSGYAFNKAHSTAYGVEAYQAAWLKRYFPAEFMAAVLTHGKGFYHPLVYVLECHRLGLRLLPPSVNEPGPAFQAQGRAIRVPLTRVKGLTTRTVDALVAAREQGPFVSMSDFARRVAPAAAELEAMIRAGGFDAFGRTRTQQFWEHLECRTRKTECGVNAELDFADSAPSADSAFHSALRTPHSALQEPSRRELLEIETELFGFAVRGHPLELFANVAWDTYCPIRRLGQFVGQTVTTCGLVVEQRTHHQITGEPMKFLTLADWTGMVETELFAATYKSYGLATVRYPVLEVEARVEPFENGNGFSLRVLRAGRPRQKAESQNP